MWTSPDGQYQNQTDYILCGQRWRSSIQSAKKQDQELTRYFAHLIGKPFNIAVIQVYSPASAEEAKVECFYEDL